MYLVLAFLLLFHCGEALAGVATNETATRASLNQATSQFPPGEGERWRTSLLRTYQARSFTPVWFVSEEPTAACLALLRELRAADTRGLQPGDYDAIALTEHVTRSRELPLMSVDVALSVAAARFAMDLHAGRVNPRRLGHDLDVPQTQADVGSFVTALAQASDVAAALDQLEPQLGQYRLLKRTLARYRALGENPELTRLPPLPTRSLQVGDTYAGAEALRSLLIAVGDLTAEQRLSVNAPLLFDAQLSTALMRFQSRHGLQADGVLGAATYRELTTPFVRRVSQISLSLERARWLPKFDTPPIIVNIPQFRLFAFRTTRDEPSEILQMDVVVGEAFPGKRTPVFASQMRYLVLRPYWDVPRSILLAELLPAIRRNSAWVERNGYEIVRGEGDDAVPQAATAENVALLERGKLRLRQKPGPDNALGLVKFMLPNTHNVYLHDTPAKSLFAHSRRAFSHGCIRVAQPFALLQHVLGDDPRWTEEALLQGMLSGAGSVRIPLPKPVPVFILYGTALVRGSREVLFFDDIYGLDARLEAAMSGGLVRDQPAVSELLPDADGDGSRGSPGRPAHRFRPRRRAHAPAA
jgi:L,D-transpeptidase YcbB